MLIPKQNRERKKAHREWIASLPCCVSKLQGHTQAAHVSKGRFSMGLKSGDNNCLPLSVWEHEMQHRLGERLYWEQYGGIEKAKTLANALYEISGNTNAALMLLARFR